MENTSELLPCPFCGGKATVLKAKDDNDFDTICCRGENCELWDTFTIEQWNARAQSPESSKKEIINNQSKLKLIQEIVVKNEYIPLHWIEEIADNIISKFGTQQSKLVPIDNDLAFRTIKDIFHPSQSDNVSLAVAELCAKFGSPYVPSLKDVRNSVRGVEVPYADPQTGRINLIKYIDDITLAIHYLLTNGKEEK